jgi:hypothetical protein
VAAAAHALAQVGAEDSRLFTRGREIFFDAPKK